MKPADTLESQLNAYSATSKSVAAQPGPWNRLSNWPIYGAAAAASLAGATSASASIIYSGLIDLTVSVNSARSSSVSNAHHAVLNSQLGLHIDQAIGSRASVGIYKTNLARLFGSLNVMGTGNAVGRLGQGALISAAKSFGAHSLLAQKFDVIVGPLAPFSTTVGNWRGSPDHSQVSGFAGVKLLAGHTALNAPLYDYGWLDLSVNSVNGYPLSVTLIDYAYQNAGGSITAGETALPEPSTASMLLLAAGFGGILAWKRHRKAAA